MPEETKQVPDLSTVAKARAEWVKALRSGEYQQARGQLQRTRQDGTVGYCCLGVAGDLCRKAGMDVEWERDTLFVDGVGYRESLPGSLAFEVFGLLGQGTDEQAELSGPNDVGATFAEIADVIEQAGEGPIGPVARGVFPR